MSGVVLKDIKKSYGAVHVIHALGTSPQGEKGEHS